MLCDLSPRGSDDKGGGGGDVEGVGPVSAGADYVHQLRAFRRYFGGELAHDSGGDGDFLDGLAFRSQGRQEAADLRIGQRP